MPNSYSRSQPSPRYVDLLAQYRRMHAEGEPNLGLAPEQTFPGASMHGGHVAAVKRMIEQTGARSILDYGSGKGMQYRPQKLMLDGRHVADGIAEYWDVDEVRCYDPGYAPFSVLPREPFDGVVCTDVLEHCPEEDVDWIVAEIFSLAARFVYANVACYPAMKRLPSGENAHITIRAPEWWRAKFAHAAGAHAGVRWELHADTLDPEQAPDAKPQAAGDPVAEIAVDGRQVRFNVPNAAARWRAETLLTKEPVTVEWIRAIPEGKVMFDVGANVGVYTLLAGICRNARVFAFEPEAQNYALLNRNLALNGLDRRVTAYCVAISDASGVDRLYLSELAAGGSCHSFGAEVGFDLAPRAAAFVQGSMSLSIDDLVASGKVPVPEYVKVDVDGFEHKVIRGMRNTLRDAKLRSIIIELNPRLPEHRAARDELVSLGFVLDPAQVERATRRGGMFDGVAEHVFGR
jgi:FkbM family methyltransferase